MMRVLLIAAVAAAAGCAGPVVPPTPGEPQATDPADRELAAEYLATVKPILAGSCLRCHGAGHALPWYHALPGVRGLIDDDVAGARRVLDLSHDYPFRGRGSPVERLDAIDDVLEDGSMPPLRYRLLHWGSRLDDAEIQTVRRFTARARATFSSPVR